MCTTTATIRPGFDNGGRGRFNAWFFTTFDRYIARIASAHKLAAFGSIAPGNIVEIGPGVGANFSYLPAGSQLVAVEPNLAMHPGLRHRAHERGLGIEVLTATAEAIPLPDASADDVLCSLVLCSVDDQRAVLAEVKRVLRPGGRFRFVEHVEASAGSPRRWLQSAIRAPWRWIYEGCDLRRDTAAAIEAAGFATVELTRGRWRRSVFVPANTSIHGIAYR